MAVESIPRRAGPFESDGVGTGFSFSFRVFKAEDVAVSVSSSSGDNAEDVPLEYLDDYTVTLNIDQEYNPGGLVVLNTPQPMGYRVTLVSRVEETQETVLTNHDGFNPTTLNTVHDKLTILVQQLSETLGRTIQVPKTSPKTSAQVLREILDIAAKANEYAAKAEFVYQETLVTKAQVEQARLHVDQQKALVDASEAEVEEDRIEVEQMLHDAQKVNAVTEKFLPHVEELVEVGNSIEDVQAVASELQGFPIDSMDLGFVRDGASPVYDAKQSNVAVLADNIALIRQVVDNLAPIQTAVESAQRAEQAAATAVESASEAVETVERVKEIEKTNFEQIYENGAD